MYATFETPFEQNRSTLIDLGLKNFLTKNDIKSALEKNDLQQVYYIAYNECVKNNDANFIGILTKFFYSIGIEVLFYVKSIPIFCFANVDLTYINIPKNITYLDTGCFIGTEIEKVTIPGSVEKIGIGIFAGSRKLKQIIIEEGVHEIMDCAFLGIRTTATIEVPDSITKINSTNAFPDTATIVCNPGSYAEEFCNKYNLHIRYK